jgi:hypothetical protein
MMGRAHSGTRAKTVPRRGTVREHDDRFTTLFGGGRGHPQRLAAAYAALAAGDYNLVLAAVDEGESGINGDLIEQLAEQFGSRLVDDTQAEVSAGLERAALLPAADLPLGLFVKKEAGCRRLRELLHREAGGHHGADVLRRGCEAEVRYTVCGQAALCLRRGGVADLRRAVGERTYRDLRANILQRSELQPRDVANVLYWSLSAEWVEEVCAHPHDRQRQMQALADGAVRYWRSVRSQ